MKATVTSDEIETKDFTRANRMEKSQAARARRKETKIIREIRRLNEWAKSRRERKNATKAA